MLYLYFFVFLVYIHIYHSNIAVSHGITRTSNYITVLSEMPEDMLAFKIGIPDSVHTLNGTYSDCQSI